MDKYEKLKSQVLDECKWCIDGINKAHPFEAYLDMRVPEGITIVDFVGNPDYNYLTDYEKGMLFAYLSLKSTVIQIEKEGD